jgi:hypothetical protein
MTPKTLTSNWWRKVAEGVGRGFLEGALDAVASVVDEYVDGAHLALDRCDGRRDGIGVGDV